MCLCGEVVNPPQGTDNMSRNFELLQRAEEQSRDTMVRVSTDTSEDTPLSEDGGQVFYAEHNGNGATALAPLDSLCRSQLDNVIQRLFLSGRKAKTVVFSSVERGAGCTWMTARLADMLAAHVKGSVCLVDGNVHSPGLHRVFGISNNLGLPEAVSDAALSKKFVQPTSAANLWLLPTKATSNGNTVLPAGYIGALIKQLNVDFDYVLIDAPPVNVYGDAISMASFTDGLVLVLKANSSRREIAQKALQDVKVANVSLLGAILNQRTFPIPEAIYKRL